MVNKIGERKITMLPELAIYVCQTIDCTNCPVQDMRDNIDISCVHNLYNWIIKESKNKEKNGMEETVKFEVVVAIPDIGNPIVNDKRLSKLDIASRAWKTFAKKFYEKTDVYVSAIVNEGRALYLKEWGCPSDGEYTVTYNCTMNPNFINGLAKYEYENGVIWIAKQLKKHFKQHTVSITKIDSKGTFMEYLTDDNCKEEK